MTPETVRKAIEACQQPPVVPSLPPDPVREARERTHGILALLARLDAEVDDRKAWIDGLRERWRLVCTSDAPPRVPWPYLGGHGGDDYELVSQGEYIVGADGSEVIAAFRRGEGGVMELTDLRVFPGDDAL